MKKFRKKPVVIEAWQASEPMVVDIPEGLMRVGPGDWIIHDVEGELYSCRDDIFRMTYEPVDD